MEWVVGEPVVDEKLSNCLEIDNTGLTTVKADIAKGTWFNLSVPKLVVVPAIVTKVVKYIPCWVQSTSRANWPSFPLLPVPIKRFICPEEVVVVVWVSE